MRRLSFAFLATALVVAGALALLQAELADMGTLAAVPASETAPSLDGHAGH